MQTKQSTGQKLRKIEEKIIIKHLKQTFSVNLTLAPLLGHKKSARQKELGEGCTELIIWASKTVELVVIFPAIFAVGKSELSEKGTYP